MGCKYDKGKGCLNCEREKCILDERQEKEKRQKDPEARKKYQHAYYLKRKEEEKKKNLCKFCGKEVSGEMIRIDGKNYCGINCVFCYLYDKNEHRMRIVNV